MLRLLSTLSLSTLWTAAAFAQGGFLGTKDDVVKTGAANPSTGSAGLMPLVQMAVVAGIAMLVLKVVIPKLTARFNRRISTTVGAGIRIEESATFAGGSLYVVSARNRTLLLSASGQGVSCLADLTDPAPKAEQPLFVDFLNEATRKSDAPARAVAQISTPDSAPDAGTVEAALRRVRELSA